MAVWAVTRGPRGYAAKSDLIEQVEGAVGGAEARVEEVRRVGEAGGAAVGWVVVADEGLHDVHDATEEMGATAECGGTNGAQDTAGWDANVEEVVEAVVYEGVWVVDGEEVVSDEDFEQGWGQVEVYARVGLWGCAGPVEDEG